MDQQHLEAYIAAQRPAYEADLRAIVEIPTISMDPARQPDIRRGAEWCRDFLIRLGATADILETSGNPIVVGRWRHPEARRTLTVYNHMDVQPADEPEWTADPFTFAVDGDTYRGRGTTDDKGPGLAVAYAFRYVHQQGLPLNLQVIWEFEEEIGSPSFEKAMIEHGAALATDSIVVSDTVWISRDRPACPLGLRGALMFALSLETGTKDVHSGLAGGAARNPLAELAAVVSALHDAKTGDILVPGIYDDVLPLSELEAREFAASGFDPARFAAAHGLKSLRYQDAAELTKRIWALPTFDVIGFTGGYQGPGIKSVVPPRAEVKLSMRLVPDMDPGKVLEQVRAYVRTLNPDVRLTAGASLQPYLGELAGGYAEALKSAVTFGFDKPPAFVREGGSIGAVVSMRKHLHAPVLFLGLSLPEHGYHAPNENFDWGMASGGMKAFAKYCEEVAGL